MHIVHNLLKSSKKYFVALPSTVKEILSLLMVPAELFAWHLYVTLPPVSSVLIHTPRSVLLEIILPFSYNVKVSTTGLLASTVQIKLTTTPAQIVGTVDKFVLKEAFSGATEKKEPKVTTFDKYFSKYKENFHTIYCTSGIEQPDRKVSIFPAKKAIPQENLHACY